MATLLICALFGLPFIVPPLAIVGVWVWRRFKGRGGV